MRYKTSNTEERKLMEILSKFHFAAPGQNTSSAENITGELIEAASREDKELKSNQKVNKQPFIEPRIAPHPSGKSMWC